MNIKSIIPAKDWYFVFKDANGKPIVSPVGVWAVVEQMSGSNDTVIGMISLFTSSIEKSTPRLAFPSPNVDGWYKHHKELTQDERDAI